VEALLIPRKLLDADVPELHDGSFVVVLQADVASAGAIGLLEI
jgi:hypothetical protein